MIFRLTLTILFTLLCSQHSEALSTRADAWVALPEVEDPLLDNLVLGNLEIPPNAASEGMWSEVFDWPMNGLHAILLADGRVLTFGTNPDGLLQDGRYYDIWDPDLGSGNDAHNTDYDPNRQDSFCAAGVALADGSLLISGGNGSTTSVIYDTVTHSTTNDPATMAEPRWYATIINLPDGRPIILGGMLPYTEDMRLAPDEAIANGWAAMTPEIYEDGSWRSLFGANSRLAFGPDYLRTSYPRAWVAPDGRVFGISAEQMWYLDADANEGNGELVSAGAFKHPYGFSSPVNVGATNTAVMFDVGKILQVGGNGGYNGDELPASDMATLIDINNATPQLMEQDPMHFARRYPNAIVLANGEIVITGGTTYGNNFQGQPASPVYATEIWDPKTAAWRLAADAAIYRGYHSITTLLTNGTILSSGGGTPGPVTNLNAEIYYPPYLFEKVGEQSTLAERPQIVAISGLSYANGAALEMDMNSDATITELVLLGTSNGTHSFNSGQRRIPLEFAQDEFRLSTSIPENTIAPPGYYQLVAINEAGVPSRGAIIGIGQNQIAPPIDPPPYEPPDISEQIPTPEISVGESVSYSITPTADTLYSWHFSDTNTATPFSSDPAITHTFQEAGAFVVTLTAQSASGASVTRSFLQAVATESTINKPTRSTQIAIDEISGRVWAVNPDNNSVAVIENNSLLSEIPVGKSPRSVAFAPDGRVWVSNKKSATLSIINPQSLNVVETVSLPHASQPHGIAFAPNGEYALLALEASGQLLKLDVNNASVPGSLELGMHIRHLGIDSESSTALVTRFITPPLPGESTAIVDTENAGAEVLHVNPVSMQHEDTILLAHSDRPDTPIEGSGIPNYLGAAAISPDGTSAWVPSKQDNIQRGMLRNGLPLDFQNSVRAISSRIDMQTLTEDYASRVDHDDSSVGSAAIFHPNGVYLFVALETSRQVAVVNALSSVELFKIDVGIAPQGLAISEDGTRLYVKEFIDRSVTTVNLQALIHYGEFATVIESVTGTVQNEKLDADVLKGKEFFYDARNPKLARDAYLSCASCHNDGGHDGRVWDFTGFGEGLRNTIALNGRAGMAHGNLHWSANFDEIQDFEKQIRDFAGGTGLMEDVDFNAGSRSEPLGDAKSGISVELDQLAAYISSLNTFAASPYSDDGFLTEDAEEGESIFNRHCIACHGGEKTTISSDENSLIDIGTITSASGQALGTELTGLDVPTLLDVWLSAPYLHDGSAATLGEAVLAHTDIELGSDALLKVVAYVRQITAASNFEEPEPPTEPDEPDPDEPEPPSTPNNGSSGTNGGNTASSGGGSVDYLLFLLLTFAVTSSIPALGVGFTPRS